MSYPRTLTDEGVTEFREYLKDIQELPRKTPPNLNQEPYSEDVSMEIPVTIDENIEFTTKMEMAEYIYDLFDEANLDMAELVEEQGLWSWLAYIWFDQLCPIDEGSRNIGQDARYICGKSYSDYSKHLITFPYYIYFLHDEDKIKLFLEHPLDYVGRITEQIGSNKYIMSSSNILEVLHILYWDREEGIKLGASSPKGPGSFRRFGKVVNQLKLTYDLHDMEPEKIIEILPSEFERWM